MNDGHFMPSVSSTASLPFRPADGNMGITDLFLKRYDILTPHCLYFFSSLGNNQNCFESYKND